MSDREPDGGERERNAPFSDMVEKVAERRGKADDEIWEEFTEQGFEPVEPDEVWNELDDDRDAPENGTPPEFDGLLRGGNGSRTANGSRTRDDVEVHTVPKRTHCERCPCFSDPPEISCSADGTEIVELVDMTRVRVKGCPIAADRDGLDELL